MGNSAERKTLLIGVVTLASGMSLSSVIEIMREKKLLSTQFM